ncbi:hypothetical protein MPNT_130037 [Candidatus Methylacidithermus pantelleriae]|uniref:Uncharacterized protein n=1 Tax=Candidatus Methylacidithermus pantelleriae TaxID=2744239 RepID=A0A8J2FNJ7_9BACT|nr:hypothetical protein MPNT_130037 [Candidatus Methylacidithermus pantelleriae]
MVAWTRLRNPIWISFVAHYLTACLRAEWILSRLLRKGSKDGLPPPGYPPSRAHLQAQPPSPRSN